MDRCSAGIELLDPPTTEQEPIMSHVARGFACIALIFSLVLTGCNAAADKEEAKAPSEPGASANSWKTQARGNHVVAKALAEPKAAQAKEDPEAEAEIAKNLAKLSPEDRKLAEAQRYCAIQEDDRLGGGAMGPPLKLVIKGKPVFLCCGQCKKDALADPDKTLAKVEELKAKNKPAEKKQ
jgi:hypothetical protein